MCRAPLHSAPQSYLFWNFGRFLAPKNILSSQSPLSGTLPSLFGLFLDPLSLAEAAPPTPPQTLRRQWAELPPTQLRSDAFRTFRTPFQSFLNAVTYFRTLFGPLVLCRSRAVNPPTNAAPPVGRALLRAAPLGRFRTIRTPFEHFPNAGRTLSPVFGPISDSSFFAETAPPTPPQTLRRLWAELPPAQLRSGAFRTFRSSNILGTRLFDPLLLLALS